MTNWNFTKIKQTAAADIAKSVKLDDDAMGMLNEEQTPADFLKLLIDDGLYADATRFLSEALPNREATWWACICARSTLGDDPEAAKMLELAEQWVYKPTEENCYSAMSSVEGTEFDTPASWAAVAAFWSGENLAPEGAGAVKPAGDLNGKAVAGAVMLAAIQDTPEDTEDRYQKFLKQGIDIACGGTGKGSAE